MNNSLEAAQHKFIENIGKLCDSFGLNRFVAQLFGVLYLSDKPLSLDDMAEKLGVSKGNVSVNIRELEEWGAVRRVWVKGSRKDYYEAELDLKKTLKNKIRSSVQKRIAEVSNMSDEFRGIIKSASGDLTEEERKMVKIYEERLGKIDELKSLAMAALALMENFL